MSCPRCGFAEATGESCHRCGVVFAKLRDRPRPQPTPPDPPPAPPSSSRGAWEVVVAIGLCIAIAVGWRMGQKAGVAPDTPATPPPGQPAAALPDDMSGASEAPAFPPPAAVNEAPSAGFSDADREAVERLVAKVNEVRVSDADVAEIASWQSRYPEEATLQKLLLEALLIRGQAQVGQRQFKDGIVTLRRAAALRWADRRAQQALLRALMAASDWPGMEVHARQMVAADPRDAEAWYALGYALFRLDRNREAAEALRACTEIRSDDRAQALLARIEKTAYDEQGMTAQNVSHFHVRYQGEEHLEVGREIVQALERHYATLVVALDHRPQSPIAVILFSGEKYHEASGAPAWAGGSFHHDDGRIRMPIGGLTRSLTPTIDTTLMHELTHAFVYDKTRGLAPREIQEGFAQYMEGHRLSSARLDELARGQIGGVHGFYLGALSFVEYLIAARGLGGMNDLFKAMSDTGSINEAFRQVHGRDFNSMQEAWRRRLQQQHGG